jgi:predicted nicotinamide N-methyase
MPTPSARFVREHTEPVTVAMIPEIRLRLATSDALDVWEATAEVGGLPAAGPPFWAFLWPGGVALARYLLDHPQVVRGRAVVDVACGSGLVGIAAAKAGAAAVHCLDVDPVAVLATRLNAQANGVQVSAVTGDAAGTDLAGADVVTAGDVFYDPSISAAMTAGLGRVAATAVVLVGDPHRTYLPADRLEPVATYDVPVDPELEGGVTTKPTLVARLRPTAGSEAVSSTSTASAAGAHPALRTAPS